MLQVKLVEATASLALANGGMKLGGVRLSADSAAAVAEIYDGSIGTVATIAVGAGGTGYEAGDILTLVQAGGGVQATVEVATVDGSGVIQTVTLLTGGTGYTAGEDYATTTDSTAGADAEITVSTVSDSGNLIDIVKAAIDTAEESSYEGGLFIGTGVSVRLTGAGAQVFLYHG